METAVLVRELNRVDRVASGCDRLYFGSEFGEFDIPNGRDVREAMAFSLESGLSFTLVTPFASDATLEHLRSLFALLPDGTEVVVGDIGVLHVLHDAFPSLVPVAGRLLWSRVVHRGGTLLRERLGVERQELPTLDASDDAGLPHKTFYMDYDFVSASRFCPTKGCERPEVDGTNETSPCKRECRDYRFRLTNPLFEGPAFLVGNAYFRKAGVGVEDAARRGVDRVVRQHLDIPPD